MKLKELQKKIARLEAELTEVKEMAVAVAMKKPDGGGVFKPEDGQEYWSISGDGNVYCGIWDNHPMDYDIYAMGNCHPTYKAAEDAVRVLKLIQKAKKSQAGYAPDWEDSTQDKYLTYFDGRRIHAYGFTSLNTAPIFGFWEDDSVCEQFIDENREELFWFFTEYQR